MYLEMVDYRIHGCETSKSADLLKASAFTSYATIILKISKPTVGKLRLADVNFVALVLNRNITKKLRLYFKNRLSRV